MTKHNAIWKTRPVKGDLVAAQRYISLLLPPARAAALVRSSRSVSCVEHVAKDLLRASHLPLLPEEEKHVAQDLKRIRKGKRLSPIVVVQGDLTQGLPLVIADGYHRLCAACHADEDTPVATLVLRQ